MKISRKNFIPRNEGFICENCGQQVDPASGTFRNHCPQCLTSKHVDQDLPGDRLSQCGGRMPAIRVEGTNRDALDLVQQCEKCGYEQTNRTASDDKYEAILSVMQNRRG